MDRELFWILLALIFIIGAMVLAAAILIINSWQPGGRRAGYYGTNWYVELWNIAIGYQVEIRFTNNYVLGRLSLYDNIIDRRPLEMDPTVSREHCLLYEQDGMLMVWNMSAVNPAVINGYRLNTPAQLLAGDRLELGNSVYLITRVERI